LEKLSGVYTREQGFMYKAALLPTLLLMTMTAHAPTRMRRVILLLGASVILGCARAVAPIVVPHQSDVALTGGFSTSMIYLARTSDGILAIDLGWWGEREALEEALKRLGATPADVRWVFLTHSHRDHLAAWPILRHANIHIAGPEHPLLVGDSLHGAVVPRWAERIKPSGLPRPGELRLTMFSQDTALVIGADTLRAYPVPGHTAGSAVYLFRGVLFLGDAVTWSRWGGFAPAKRGVSDDTGAAAANLSRLWARLPPGSVRYACTAHAKCAPFDARFLSDIAR
jgi:glyoxylase-like metal-dependent hydrolase (beta-lactamase superfamily II)